MMLVYTEKPLPERAFKQEVIEAAQNALDSWSPGDVKPSSDGMFNVVDFFSGAGGMTLGFQALSKVAPFFNIAGGCDIDPDASRTFEANFKAPGIVLDVRDLAENDTAFEEFKSRLNGLENGKPLIVIGCPPCQGFTTHRKKRWDTEEDDDRNTLVGVFASIAVRLNPVAIVMENVPEMLADKYWSHFEEARTIFERNGYVVKQTIYNSASFGVPQERFRAILVAMKREFLMPEPIISDPANFMTVRQAIGHLPKVEPGEKTPGDSLHVSANHRKSTIETIKAVPKDGGNRPRGVGPKCLDRVKGFSDVYGRLYWDRPAITITHYSRNPASGRFVHPEQNRGLTMREAASLQSFPASFEFTGTFDSTFKQIGEAVPPKLACAVAASLLVELLSDPPNEKEIEEGIQPIVEPVSSSYSSVIAGIKASRRSQ